MFRRLPAIIFSAALCLGAGQPCAYGQGLELPDMGDSAGRLISPTGERAYGTRMYQQFLQAALVIDDPLVVDYIEYLCYRLVAESDRSDGKFNFFVVDSDVLNAFAAPGGYIGLHSELILTAEAESELAAVVAHEIAHVTQRHLVRAFEDASRMSIPMALATLGAILASGGDGDVIQAAVVGGQALMAQRQINFTRSNEHEADRIGIQTLSRAGLRPEAMATFFGRMGKASRLYGEGPPEFLRTHPVTTTRIAEAKSRAEALDEGADFDNDKFLHIRERLRALTSEDIRGTVEQYENDLGGKEIRDEPAAYYGYALALLRNGRPERARAIVDSLLALSPSHVSYRMLFAEATSDLDEHEKALNLYADLMSSQPGNLPVMMGYATTLLATDDKDNASKAERMLRPELLRHTNRPGLLGLYARVADDAGETTRAAEATAERHFAMGATYEAIKQLERLAKKSSLNHYERSRVNARIAEIRPLLTDDEFEQEEREERRRRVRSAP